MAPAGNMYQHAAEFFDEHVSTAKPIGSVSWRTANLGMRKPDPASQREAVKSHRQIRRSMESVQSVRWNPYPQVSILPGVRHRRP
jgi:hypothetical protein